MRGFWNDTLCGFDDGASDPGGGLAAKVKWIMVQYTRFPPKVRRTAPQPPEQEAALPEAASDTLPYTGQTASKITRTQTTRASAKSSGARSENPLSGAVSGTAALSGVVVILMISIIMPIYFNVGSLRLSPSRLVLVAMCLPVFFYWATGKAGRIRITDILILLYALWVVIAVLMTEGIADIEFIGITVIEIFCPYMLARCYIRTEEQYASLLKVLYVIALLLAPAAMLEAVTGFRIYTKIFDPLFAVFPSVNYEKRLGMTRAQTVFEHPILFGVYIAMFFAPIYLAARGAQKSALKAMLIASPVGAATFFSLSAGAYLGLMVQLLLIGWGYAMRRSPKRWQIMTTLVAVAFVVVDLVSNRSPFEVFISYLTFDASNSYWRVLIFSFGMENVWAHPFFGLGLKDWARPFWMHTASVDNFWLLTTMRYGIPAFLLLAAAYGSVIAALVRSRPASPSIQLHKLGLLFMLIGLAIAACTVHLWNNTAIFMIFMMGAGRWISEADGAVKDGQENGGAARSWPPRAFSGTKGAISGQAFVSPGATGSDQNRPSVRQRPERST